MGLGKALKKITKGGPIGALAGTAFGRLTPAGMAVNTLFRNRGGGGAPQDWMQAQNQAYDDARRQDEINLVGTGFNNQNIQGRDAAIKYDSAGRPIRSSYLSVTDADGKLRNQFSMADKIGPDVQLNRQGLDEIRSRALSQGPSAWAQLANQQQGMQEQQAMSQASRNNAAQMRQGMSSLAGRSGLSAGARERMALQGMRQGNASNQSVLNQGMQNRMNINLQDQQMKDQMLQKLPGQEMNAANFDQSQRVYRNTAMANDIGTALKDIGGYNAYRADAYGKAMQEWGNEKTANAQAQASRGGGSKK